MTQDIPRFRVNTDMLLNYITIVASAFYALQGVLFLTQDIPRFRVKLVRPPGAVDTMETIQTLPVKGKRNQKK